MELDELKDMWLELDNRLQSKKLLEERIIKEMIDSKANKSVSRLVGWDIFNFIIFLLLIPFCVYSYMTFGGRFSIWDMYVCFAGIICVVGLPWYCWRLYYLFKIDLAGKLSKNIYYVNKFRVLARWEKISLHFVGLTFVFLAVLMSIQIKVALYVYIIIGCLFVLAAVLTELGYKRITVKHIKILKKSLEDLEELREAEEG